jgi:hypothetical protein
VRYIPASVLMACFCNLPLMLEQGVDTHACGVVEISG